MTRRVRPLRRSPVNRGHPKGIADDIPESHGWRQLKKRITILNAADLDAAIPFVEAAYRARP